MKRPFAGRLTLGVAVILTAATCSISLAGAGSAPGVPHAGINEKDSPELEKKIPITRAGAPRTIVNLSPDDLGPVQAGDRIEAFSEVEVSVTCLERMSKCVGKIYSFSPRVKAQLVLANGRGERGVAVGRPESLTCAQDLPSRNHHCVLALDRSQILRNTPPCAPRCSLNLVVEASHPRARKGNVLVIGSDEDQGILQNRASLSAGVFEPMGGYDPRIIKTNHRLVKAVSIEKSDTREVTVVSIRLNGLRRGEVLAIQGRVVSNVSRYKYGVLSQGQIVISEKRGSSDNHGIPLAVTTRNGKVTAKNGFNCTQGRSAHQSPCLIEKNGWVRIVRDARSKPNQDAGPRVPLFVNFFVGFKDEYTYGRPHRNGDKAKIKSARLEVKRYTPANLPR